MKKFKIIITIYCLFVTSLNFCLERKVFLSSIPKCGTHLAKKCIELLTKKRGAALNTNQIRNNSFYKNSFFYSHELYNSNNYNYLLKNNYKLFFIFRDPRDQIVSHAFWILKLKDKQIYDNFKELKTISEIISALIKSIDSVYINYLKWKEQPSVFSIKFENLVGQKGGGSFAKQINEINRMAKHIDIKINLKTIKKIANNLFGNTGTFRQGKIGSWKNHFSLEHKKAFKKVAGQLLIDLGYEKDLNW